MTDKRLIALATAMIAVCLPAAAQANDKAPFSLEVSAGLGYDSHVTVDAADLTASAGDELLNLELESSYKLIDNKSTSFEVGYDFSQSLHRDLTAFDIQSHSPSVAGSVKVSGAKIGLKYSYYHTLLGGSRFLDMHVLNPSISGFVAKRVYLRGSYSYTDKRFAVLTNRDAKNQRGGLDGFYFFAKSKGFVSLGAHVERENAVDAQLDYDGYALNAGLQVPLKLTGKGGKLNLSYAYRVRNYDNITLSLGQKRREDRSIFRAQAESPLFGGLSLGLMYQYTDRNSNFLFSNYTENLATSSLIYKF